MEIEVIVNEEVNFTRKLPNRILFNQTPTPFTIRIPKKPNYKNKYSSESSSSSSNDDDDDESEVFDELEQEEDEEDRIDNSVGNNQSDSNNSYGQRKMLRRYGMMPSAEENLLYMLSGNKKPKKKLTEEEIAKKTEQMRIRKLHAKKMIEEEKREAVERILNEDGRKLRERQRKLNAEIDKKNKVKEEKFKFSLTKIKHKYLKDGSIYVRFPKGLLLPSVLLQKKRELKPVEYCQVNGCSNIKKYKHPKSGLNYCSVSCYKNII